MGERMKNKKEGRETLETGKDSECLEENETPGSPPTRGKKREKEKREKRIGHSLRVFSKGGRGHLWAFAVSWEKRKKEDRV